MVTATRNGQATAKTLPDDGWLIDVDVKNKERKAFFAAQKQAQAEDKEELIYPWLARFIERWPYKFDPSDVASYEEIKTSEMFEAVTRVTAAFQRLVERYAGERDV